MREIKSQQWHIVYYCSLVFAGLIGFSKVIPSLSEKGTIILFLFSLVILVFGIFAVSRNQNLLKKNRRKTLEIEQNFVFKEHFHKGTVKKSYTTYWFHWMYWIPYKIAILVGFAFTLWYLSKELNLLETFEINSDIIIKPFVGGETNMQGTTFGIWDIFSGLGTFFVAIVAIIFGLIPLYKERVRNKRNANRLRFRLVKELAFLSKYLPKLPEKPNVERGSLFARPEIKKIYEDSLKKLELVYEQSLLLDEEEIGRLEFLIITFMCGIADGYLPDSDIKDLLLAFKELSDLLNDRIYRKYNTKKKVKNN